MARFNNSFKVPNEKADEIRRASHNDLIARASMEYENWLGVKKQKKADPQIQNVRDSIKGFDEEIREDPEYQQLESDFKAAKEQMVTEEHATLKEELKNLNQPYNEDIKAFENLFKLCMEEIRERKEAGLL